MSRFSNAIGMKIEGSLTYFPPSEVLRPAARLSINARFQGYLLTQITKMIYSGIWVLAKRKFTGANSTTGLIGGRLAKTFTYLFMRFRSSFCIRTMFIFLHVSLRSPDHHKIPMHLYLLKRKITTTSHNTLPFFQLHDKSFYSQSNPVLFSTKHCQSILNSLFFVNTKALPSHKMNPPFSPPLTLFIRR